MHRLAWSAVLALAACSACGDGEGLRPADDPSLGPDDAGVTQLEAGAAALDIHTAVKEGILTRGAAADPHRTNPDARLAAALDSVRFVVIRAADRYGVDYRPDAFHVVVGAGVAQPEGSLRIRRDWNTSGMVDGNNEFPEKHGVAVVVEPQAPRPFTPKVAEAVARVVAAVAQVAPVHPDCVVAMGEVPYTNLHEADPDERALAAKAREGLRPPPVDGSLVIRAAGGPVEVSYERRDTPLGIAVGMMLRRGFDGDDRGMLFTYPNPDYRYFWMFNCLVPIDVAFIGEDGTIDVIHSMEVEVDPRKRPRSEEWRRYPSRAAVKHVLEMPRGWFERRGVKAGDPVELE